MARSEVWEQKGFVAPGLQDRITRSIARAIDHPGTMVAAGEPSSSYDLAPWPSRCRSKGQGKIVLTLGDADAIIAHELDAAAESRLAPVEHV